MWRDAKLGFVTLVFVASVTLDVAAESDISCENGQTFGRGIIRETDDKHFVVECDVGFETSLNDEVKCRDGVVVVEESAECLPVEPSLSPTVRKIRSSERLQSGKRPQHDHDSKRKRKANDDNGRRLKRRKTIHRRRKNGFQVSLLFFLLCLSLIFQINKLDSLSLRRLLSLV